VDVVPYLSAVILVATIATIALAVISYLAFKLRDRRRPVKGAGDPVFFRPFPSGGDADDEEGGKEIP
jgi:hypothetical protein